MTTEKKNLDEYLQEIGRAKLLTIDEERELLKAVQEKGAESEEMKQLEKSFARFVVSLSGQYRNKGLTISFLRWPGSSLGASTRRHRLRT